MHRGFRVRTGRLAGISLAAVAAGILSLGASARADDVPFFLLDAKLRDVLRANHFDGKTDFTLERRLGRRLDPDKVELGRNLFFDNILGLHNDNACAGCHSPAFGFGDSQPMAIGVDNNGIVGPNRKGPRNQRRSPLVVNTGFYPALMWTARFEALSGDPFDNSQGFLFPPPENLITSTQTLLQAQGSLPSTELVEMAGFTGITANPGPFGPRHFQFDDGHGETLPAPDATGFHNFPIQDRVDARLNANPGYRRLFSIAFNHGAPLPPGGITIGMRRIAIAEFQMSIRGANAPLDRYARGETFALSLSEKRGALLFFGKARCSQCHSVSGEASEMFSDFKLHRIGVPQLAPVFGKGTGDVIFDGPGENEDFGVEQTAGDPALRYMFRSAPLRNLAVAPAFFHNGAFRTLEGAILHHLNVRRSLLEYDPKKAGAAPDLKVGPAAPILAAGIDPLLVKPILLGPDEFKDLVDFVRDGLFDKSVLDLCRLIPKQLPSGFPVARYEGCEAFQQ